METTQKSFEAGQKVWHWDAFMGWESATVQVHKGADVVLHFEDECGTCICETAFTFAEKDDEAVRAMFDFNPKDA